MDTDATTGEVQPDVSRRAGLYRKIAAVTAAVERIPKHGRNQHFGYDYALESDITDGLRGLLAEHGVACLPPTVLHWERGEPDARNNSLTRVQYRFGLADCETGETVESLWWGEAQDNADKAFNKAATSAAKYWLLKTFLIATGDDPDDGPSEERKPAPRQAPRQAASTNLPPAPAPTGAREPRQQAPANAPTASRAPTAAEDISNAAFWPEAYELIGQRDAKAVHSALGIASLKEDWLNNGRTRRDAIWVLRELTTGRSLGDVLADLRGPTVDPVTGEALAELVL